MFDKQQMISELNSIPAGEYPLQGNVRDQVVLWLEHTAHTLDFVSLFGSGGHSGQELIVSFGYTLLGLLRAADDSERLQAISAFINDSNPNVIIDFLSEL